MRKFVIISSSSQDFSVVVMATGVALPQENLEDVADELRRRHVSGSVVFDLLASNGSRHCRFYKASFDGFAFCDRPRFSPVEPDTSIREETARYLQGHIDEFDLSLLTPAMMFAAKRGVAL
ncbi:hypothetical protein XaraCFBP7407_19205 [Xanthomonas arboricola pv. arracaciae]|uniref:type II toxin-antitoxin system RnlB family antitoxin n=1 Tax=Xanthomonas arboricola TaxID=56448 RepID=UPI000CED983F|nr:hypothetical protein XaraCFBP7407_19205 [Xanthomonas arboricola pv. arracaciae]